VAGRAIPDAHDTTPVAGQAGAAFRRRNPQGLVPVLTTDAGEDLTQSMAILEWLQATHPDPARYPDDAN